MFILDRNKIANKQMLLSAFDSFDKKIEFVCISHEPSLEVGTIIEKKYKDNIFHYFINNEPTNLTDDWSKFKGNYPMLKQIIKQHSNSKYDSLFDKICYKLWKHLDKKLRQKGIIHD